MRDIGIGVKFHERVFEIFGRLYTQDRYPGIGLAICRRIVRRHGGRIWLESEEGKGSRFYFGIPERRAEPKSSDEARFTTCRRELAERLCARFFNYSFVTSISARKMSTCEYLRLYSSKNLSLAPCFA